MQRSHVAARRGGAGIAALLAGLVLALLLPALAHAVPPLRVTDVVTDTTGRVDRVADIEAAAERLRDETGAGFYYIVVDRFDDPADGFDWASEVAERSALGDDDAIVYVSLGQNDFGLNVSSAMALSTGDVRDIELAVGERLDRGEYGEAGIVAADAIRAALVGADGGDGGASPDGASSSGPGLGQTILAGGLLVAALTAIVLINRARKRKEAAAEEDVEARRAARLQDASQRLVRSDDLIRSAQEELGFAEAGFGAEAVGPFRAALDEAQGLAHEAFDLQAKLLDRIPDSPQQRDEWITGIVHRTERADGLLRAEIERFGELRGRQERAPELLAAVERRLGEAGSRLDGAGARVDRIRPGLEPAAIAPFDADLEQARRLVDLARDEAGNAAQGLAAGAVGPAVVDIGDAESALVQFERLVEGLDREAGRVESAPATIAAETTALRQDLGRLQQLHRDSSGRFSL
ncbi:MAG: TPM domain-containing protein, partial [Microbacteriaceae bacterium]|nr:TPM domain-containing protein [Microbacteriaceae bacterium]